jgi:hypothetical protein
MVKMGMGQQHEIDAGRVEAEIGGVFFVKVAAALEHAAIDQKPPSAAFDHMAGSGDAPIGAMKRQLHSSLP